MPPRNLILGFYFVIYEVVISTEAGKNEVRERQTLLRVESEALFGALETELCMLGKHYSYRTTKLQSVP